MYAIKWRSKITAASGSGAYVLDSETAMKWCEMLNIKFPEIEHWIEGQGE